ncbi:MAG TPA: HPr family phosphocarrier protein [Candidatus Eisenbacteria bacterium]|nr:HPr family phosphocarrier protein [Candidatus Eisenbacteria bacterium]
MKEAVLQLAHQDAFHLRPASKFARVTSRYRSRIWVEREGVEVDGKSVLGLLLLAPLAGLEVHVRAEGIDEDEALEAIRHYFDQDQQQFEEDGLGEG